MREPTDLFVPNAFLSGYPLCFTWVLVRSNTETVNTQIGCQHPLNEHMANPVDKIDQHRRGACAVW